MAKYAYVVNNVAQEVVRVDPSSIFNPGYAALFIDVPDEVEAGWILTDGEWSPHTCPPIVDPDDLIKQAIVALESQQTPRRIREATLGIDNGWLAGIEVQIEALRAQLEGA